MDPEFGASSIGTRFERLLRPPSWHVVRLAVLGNRSARASWVLNAGTGEPTGYTDVERDADLHLTAEITIESGDEQFAELKREK